MEKTQEAPKRGPKPKGDRKKIPLRVWAERRQVDANGGRDKVQAYLTAVFEKLPEIVHAAFPFDPRTELKEGEGS